VLQPLDPASARLLASPGTASVTRNMPVGRSRYGFLVVATLILRGNQDFHRLVVADLRRACWFRCRHRRALPENLMSALMAAGGRPRLAGSET